MNLLRTGLRFWLTVTSILSFLIGWVMLSHAPKPVQAASPETLAALPTLEPLNSVPNFGSGDPGFENQPFFNSLPSHRSQFRPLFRTGGS